MNIERIDLNLLLALDALLTERNVTRAAERIGITQPAMSNALARLRMLFEDPILVRTGREMVISARAHQLMPAVRQAMNILRRALDDTQPSSPRTFVIGVTEYAEVLLLPEIIRNFKTRHTGRIVVRRLTTLFQAPEDDLHAGVLDLAIAFAPAAPAPRPGIESRALFEERSVCVARRGTFKTRALGLREYLKHDHVAVSYQHDAPSILDRELAAHGVERRVALQVPHLWTALWMISKGSLVTVVPERFADIFIPRLRIEKRDLPIQIGPLTLTLKMLWHSRTHGDTDAERLRSHIANVSRKISSAS